MVKQKHVLLDTNIIINSSIAPEEYGNFFAYLKEYNYTPLTNEFIRIEYLSESESYSSYKEKLEYFAAIMGGHMKEVLELPVDRQTIQSAEYIGLLYTNKRKKGIGHIDKIIAAQLKKYGSNLWLATENHKDFPQLLFNRDGVHCVEIGDEVKTIGLYQFSPTKYEKAVTDFRKSA